MGLCCREGSASQDFSILISEYVIALTSEVNKFRILKESADREEDGIGMEDQP